jgi:hypothetical protein
MAGETPDPFKERLNMEKKITIRFKTEEFEWVRAQADSQGWSYADYIRLKIREDHPVTHIQKRKRPALKAPVQKCDPRLLWQVSQIGNNLNQLARIANSTKTLSPELLMQLKKIEASVGELIS